MLLNRCVRCDQVIEAPDEQRGATIACPHCEATNVLRSADDRVADADAAERRERSAFLRRLERPGDPAPGAPAGPAGAPTWSAPIEAGHAGDLVHLAGRRLRDMADYMTLFAYVLLALSLLVGGGLALTGRLALLERGLAFGVGTFAGVLAFVFFKFLADAARALADLATLARALDARLARVEAAALVAREEVTPTEPPRAHPPEEPHARGL